MFSEEELSQADVVDVLIEEQIYSKKALASEFVLDSWVKIERRLSWMGIQGPIHFEDKRMVRQKDWREVPAHSFCLAVSLGPKFKYWHRDFGPDYTEQGSLFELITKFAMKNRFIGWNFHLTGWSKDNVSKLPAVVDNLVAAIGERRGNVGDYSSENAKDAGLDLVWHLPFVDRRGGDPVYLAQCASGVDWIKKLPQPNMEDWNKIIDFANRPNKAFSLPFALDDKTVRWRSNTVGLLLDRYRLLVHEIPEDEWIPQELRDRLITWLEPRVDWICDR